MSDNNKNDIKAAAETELSVKQGDIVWHITDKCICEVTSVRLQPKPYIYVVRIAGGRSYNNEPTQHEIELLLSKEQISYEVVTSDNAIKAFYKDKAVMDLEFELELKDSIEILSYALSSVRRNYIYNQLLEMYPDTKISRAIINGWY